MKITNHDPKEWGPKTWFYFETMVRSLPDVITNEDAIDIKNYFILTAKLLPCEICKQHMTEYIAETHLIDIDFTKKENIVNWLHNLHNMRTTTPRTKEEVNQYYKYIYELKNQTTFTDCIIILIVIGILTILRKRLS